MTDPKGNNEFCFPKNLNAYFAFNVSRDEVEGNIESKTSVKDTQSDCGE